MSRAARYGRRRVKPQDLTPKMHEQSLDLSTESTKNGNEVASVFDQQNDTKETTTMAEENITDPTDNLGTIHTAPAIEAQPPWDLSGPGEPSLSNSTCNPIDAHQLLSYLWEATDRAEGEVTDPAKETAKSIGSAETLRAVTRQVTKMALGME